MLQGTVWTHILLSGLLCLVLPFVTGKTKPEVGSVCRTSSGLQGRCVDSQNCPKLQTIIEKRYVNWQEMDLLKGAAGACSQKQFCCADGDIRWDTGSDQQCLQTSLGMDGGSIGSASRDTSFGVFITYTSGKYKRSRCVGSLITPKYVLTAAHCVPNLSGLVLYVNAQNVTRDAVLGDLKGDVKPSYVREIIRHEQYNIPERDNDIALLRLNESFAQGDINSPKPICIPMTVVSVAQALHCLGWGENAEGIPSASKQWITLERISHEVCQTHMDSLQPAMKQRVLITDRNICTMSITGHDAFKGYSGGPLMYRKNGVWFLIGLINYGIANISIEFPVVSLNVQQYTHWIQDNIRRRQ